MDLANQLILLGGGLLILAILAGLVSSRVGAPLLLVFLALGMVAGREGLGWMAFEDFEGAYLIGSLALAVILFDGGLRTPLASIRAAAGPAGVLSTLGVLLTAGVTGGAAMLVLGFDLIEGMLVGAIVASTDAAAVFLLLHQHGMDLRRKLQATLEVESGVNDPMAVFLTVTLVELVAAGVLGNSGANPGWAVLGGFVQQLGLGLILGGLGGLALGWLVNRLELAPGLYPVFVIAAAFVIFGGTQELGGSGFLAVYLAGIVAGNRRLRANQLIRRFHDGMAWTSQIVMFVMLGVLVTPSELVADLLPAVAVALVLMFVARPLAVFLCLLPFKFAMEERIFISWVGLRGAVPIFLAIIPVLGLDGQPTSYFHVAFIVVLTSLLLQGWTVPWLARKLELELPARPEAVSRQDIELSGSLDSELVGYRIEGTTPAIRKHFADIALPRHTSVVAVLRDSQVIRPENLEKLDPGDYLLAVCPPEQAYALDQLFAPQAQSTWARQRPQAALGDFAVAGDATLGRLADEYDLAVTRGARDQDVASYLAELLPEPVSVGDRAPFGDVELVVRAIDDEARISQVGIVLDPSRPHLPTTRAAHAVRDFAVRLVARTKKGRPAVAPADDGDPSR